jgi:hypothetical protein
LWWLNFAGEVALAALFMAALLFIMTAVLGRGGVGGGRAGRGRAQAKGTGGGAATGGPGGGSAAGMQEVQGAAAL